MSTVFFLSVATGCAVTKKDIQTWETTVKGPEKIVRLLTSRKEHYAIELRFEAAYALIEMDNRRDADGLKLLDTALTKLHNEQPALEAQVISDLVPRLTTLISAEDATNETERKDPSKLLTRVKDAAFMLTKRTDGSQHQTLTEAIIAWYARDYTRRSLEGNYSAEQIIRELGAPAANILAGSLHEQVPALTLLKLTELVSQLADEEGKALGAAKLLDTETKVRSKEFVTWLQERSRTQLKEAGEEPDDARIQKMAEYNRGLMLTQGVLPSMKFLSGQKVIADRLVEIAMAAPPENASAALVELSNLHRLSALHSLEGGARAEHLDAMLKLALNENLSLGIRDAAFQRIADIDDPKALPALWPLVEQAGCVSTPCDAAQKLAMRLRWRAGELVLSIGKTAALDAFLRHLPNNPDVHYDPAELTAYATSIRQFAPPPVDFMQQQLRSNKWWGRVLAIRFVEKNAKTAEDAAVLDELVENQTATIGENWDSLENIGKVAQAASAAIRQRFTPQQSPIQDSEG